MDEQRIQQLETRIKQLEARVETLDRLALKLNGSYDTTTIPVSINGVSRNITHATP